jgi:hypothetical protein
MERFRGRKDEGRAESIRAKIARKRQTSQNHGLTGGPVKVAGSSRDGIWRSTMPPKPRTPAAAGRSSGRPEREFRLAEKRGEFNMIGMNFISFLILLVVSVAVSAVLHYGLKYYVTPGLWSFCSKVVVAWIGAWLGSPVLGYWPHEIPMLGYGNIWFIPAILGSLAALVLAVDLVKMGRGAS